MTSVFTIKRGDLLPDLDANLQNPDGSPIDLTAVASLKFNMKPRNGSTMLGGACEIVGDPVSGNIRYQWQIPDTSATGVYYGEFEITWVGNKKQTIPSDGYLLIKVIEELD